MDKNIVCFGEVLWDILPAKTVPGGAPMNVAIRAESLGLHAAIISRIGNDYPGEKMINYLADKGLDISLLQNDFDYPTGKVNVVLSPNGEATFDIRYPSAWDMIELSESAIEKVRMADAFIYGSLACRHEISRNTLLNLLEYAHFKVFDVNLRPGFFDITLIEKLIRSSDLVKLNDEELKILADSFGSKQSGLKENMVFLHHKLGIKSVCVTCGKEGALLFIENKHYSIPGIEVSVVDTVGSGDSFLAALLYKLLPGCDYDESLAFACATGAAVATKSGANPELSIEEINSLIN